MALNVTQKLIQLHLLEGDLQPGGEIALKVDQTLLQDVLGTLVMLELEAMGVDRVRVEPAVQYVDHSLVQDNHLNADEHLFLRSACRRFGVWYSRPGNGISHPVHMQRFGKPGATLVGSDSHTPAAGSLGMLAFGAGGVEVALAMTGQPLHLRMPQVWGVHLTGRLPEWVSAKDVILEMLRRHGVEGGLGRIIEYHGPGLACLSAMDRHVIANMGAELGATTTVFPSDEATRRFLRNEGREEDWTEITADADAGYDLHEEIDLSRLEPLIAKPSSPGNVVPVREVAGLEIYQAYIGSSANPGYRDFAIAAHMVRGRQVHDRVSFDINPTSRQLLENLIAEGLLKDLVHAGGRLHQAGCNGCIGMGQAPASGRNSLRTVPRNFPGRSGTREDSVFLCSPETATASALTGRITDPRDLGIPYPKVEPPKRPIVNTAMLVPPYPRRRADRQRWRRRPTSPRSRSSASSRTTCRCPSCSSWATISRPTTSCPQARASCLSGATSPRRASSPSSRSTPPIRVAPRKWRRAVTPSSPATITAKARAARTRRSPRATWAWLSCSRGVLPASIGRTWSILASCR
jgi:aconitate hydratase